MTRGPHLADLLQQIADALADMTTPVGPYELHDVVFSPKDGRCTEFSYTFHFTQRKPHEQA